MDVKLLIAPTDEDWRGVYQRALVTVGKESDRVPGLEWRRRILRARHSPIRYLRFSFMLKDIPYFASVHLARHVHAQPYVRSQRNDRQNDYDRNAARQDAPVDMILDVNAEEFITICNKRLCFKADPVTRQIVSMMRDEAVRNGGWHDFVDELVPRCMREKGCNEMQSCGYWEGQQDVDSD